MDLLAGTKECEGAWKLTQPFLVLTIPCKALMASVPFKGRPDRTSALIDHSHPPNLDFFVLCKEVVVYVVANLGREIEKAEDVDRFLLFLRVKGRRVSAYHR